MIRSFAEQRAYERDIRKAWLEQVVALGLSCSEAAAHVGTSRQQLSRACDSFGVTGFAAPDPDAPYRTRPVPPVASPLASEFVNQVIALRARKLSVPEIAALTHFPQHRVQFVVERLK